MKCFQCKKEINEFEEYIPIGDFDLVCSKECLEKYEKDKDVFFENIGNDKWYDNYMNGEKIC